MNMEDDLSFLFDDIATATGDKSVLKYKTAPKPKTNYDVSPLLERMLSGVSGQESGGNTRAVNARTSATGEFQVMPANIPSWTKTYLGKPLSVEEFKSNPQAQKQVFRGEMGKYLEKAMRKAGGNEDQAVRMAAAAWYGGEGAMHRYDDPTKFRPNEPSFQEYTSSVLRRIKGVKNPQSAKPMDLSFLQDDIEKVIGANVAEQPSRDLSFLAEDIKKVTGTAPSPTFPAPVAPVPVNPFPAPVVPTTNEAEAADINSLGTAKVGRTNFGTPPPPTPLPADYVEFIKAREIPDSTAARNEYSQMRQSNPEAYNSVPKNVPPVPESNFTITEQIRSALKPDSPRAAVLLTEPNQFQTIASGQKEFFTPVATSNGTLLVVNEKATKLGLKNPEEIFKHVEKNGFASLIGKVEDVGNETSQGTAVRTETPEGHELSTSVVTTPEAATAQIIQDQQEHKGNIGKQEILPTQHAVQKRIDKLPAQPAKSAASGGTSVLSENQPVQGGQAIDPTPEQLAEAERQNPATDFSPWENARKIVSNPEMVEAATETEILDKGSAGSFEIDLSKKPKGENAGRFLLKEALRRAAPEYGFSDADIERAVDPNARGNTYYDQVDDSNIQKVLGSLEGENGTANVRVDLTNRNINEVLKKRDKSVENIHPELQTRIGMETAMTPQGIEQSGRESSERASREELRASTDRDLSAFDTPVIKEVLSRIWDKPSRLFTGEDAEITKEEKDRLVNNIVEDSIAGAGSAQEVQRLAKEYAAMGDPETAVKHVGGFVKSIAKFPASFAKTAAWAEDSIRFLRENGVALPSVTSTDFLEAADWVWSKTLGLPEAPGKESRETVPMLLARAIEKALPEDKTIANTVAGKIGSGLGNAAAFMLMGAATGGTGLAMGLIGVGASVGEQYDSAKQAGLSRERQLLGGLAGIPLGATEAFGFKFGKFGELLQDATQGRFAPVAKKFLTRVGEIGQKTVTETGEEFFQELGQTFGGELVNSALKNSGLTKQDFLNATAKGFESAKYAALSGGLMGGGMSAAGQAGEMRASRTPNESTTNEIRVEDLAAEQPPVTAVSEISLTETGANPTVGAVIEAADKAKNVTPRKNQPVSVKAEIDNTTPAPRELLSENPKRIATAQADAVQKAAIDTRAQKVVENLKNKGAISIGELQKSTRFNKTNVEDAVMLLYAAKQVEILPDNSVRFIGSETITTSKSLFERASEIDKPAEPIELQKSSIESEIQPVKNSTNTDLVAGGVRTPIVKPPHEFSSTQVNLPKDVSNQVVNFGKSLIKKEDLAEDGYETEPHITVKFGLHTNDVADVSQILAGEKPFEAKLGKTSIFPASENGNNYDVVKIDIESAELHRLNKLIADNTDVTDSHPTYKPHLTLAYVKAGTGKNYVGGNELEGKTIKFDSITFSDKNRNKVSIPLGKTNSIEDTYARLPTQAESKTQESGQSRLEDSPVYDKPNTAQKSNSGFYSQLEKTVSEKMPVRASAEQVRGIINNPQTGIKAEERAWLGIDEWLEGKDKVSKTEVLDFVRENQVEVQEVVKSETTNVEERAKEIAYEQISSQSTWEEYIDPSGEIDYGNTSEDELFDIAWDAFKDDYLSKAKEEIQADSTENSTKFSQYTLPGGENYKELLLTMPNAPKEFPSFGQWLRTRYGSGEIPQRVQYAARQEYQKQKLGESKFQSEYRSSHFDESNILAHIRFDERTINEQGAKEWNSLYGQQSAAIKGGDTAEANLIGQRMRDTETGSNRPMRTMHIAEIQSDFGQDLRKESNKINREVDENFDKIVQKMEMSKELEIEC